MKTFKQYIIETTTPTFWHGSPSGKFVTGTTGIHIGTRQAAKEALEARIGVPATGEWDGTRKYGETKLAGKKTLAKPENIYRSTGHNVDALEHDYYPHERKDRAKYSGGEEIGHDEKPNIFPVKIVGPMSNTPATPHQDFKANGYMRGMLLKAQGGYSKAKRGFYYNNQGEHPGSLSAVVPSPAHLSKMDN